LSETKEAKHCTKSSNGKHPYNGAL